MSTRSVTKSAAARIQNFFRKTGTPRKSAFLNAVCSDSGQCIVFGKETQKIKEYFHNFDFTYVDADQIQRIGKPSANGFVTEIPYEKKGYSSYAVLKSVLDAFQDNSFYEAFVGTFINKKGLYYPCFVETYGCYYYTDPELYSKLEKSDTCTKKDLVHGLKKKADLTYSSFLDKDLLSQSCSHPTRFSILIQHLHRNNSKSLHDLLLKHSKEKGFFTIDLVGYFFQIYAPLAMLYDEFTHYDLHLNNVLVYFPSKQNKYVRMIYHYSDTATIEFNTFGITKMIDYGHSYVNDKKERVNSKMIYDKICDIRECDDEEGDEDEKQNCGYIKGYSWLEDDVPYGSQHYISSQKRNMSHDLRALDSVLFSRYDTYSGKDSHYMKSILDNIIYEDSYLVSKGEKDEGYGTKEIAQSKFIKFGDPIQNVKDAYKALKKIILNEPYFKKENERMVEGLEKLGELHIWLDESKLMEYIPV
jgi:hypothetical protein